MLENATIIRITAPNAPGADGYVGYTPAVGTLSIRCGQSRVRREQRFAIGAVINDATTMIRVLMDRLGALVIEENYQVQVQLDRRTSQTYFVVYVNETVKDGISSVVAFLRKA